MGLAGARRAEQHDVAGLGQKRPRGQSGDLVSDGGLGVEVEILQRLGCTESRCSDPQSGPGGVTGTYFAFEDRG